MIWPFDKPRKKGRATRIKVTPPTPASDRGGVALIAIAKNEEKRIGDWLTFHALAGVREVILYDNMSDDRTAEIARNFKGMTVTVIPWELNATLRSPELLLPRQTLAYCHAISTFGAKFRWVALIDIDEYIVPKSHSSIEEVLEPLEQFANISLPWAMFGHNGHESPPNLPVPFAYTQRAEISAGPLLNFKCLLDPAEVVKVDVHRFETTSMGTKSANTLGKTTENKQRKTSAFATTELLQLNHYYLMSKQDTAEKLAKGAVSSTEVERRNKSVLEKQKLIEAQPREDTTALDFLKRRGVADAAEFKSLFRDY